jgi:hypothetical protein
LFDFQLPLQDKERPNLIALERNTSLALGFGHPLLMDGWRPMAPNFVPIGMMNCRPTKPFPEGCNFRTFLDAEKMQNS